MRDEFPAQLKREFITAAIVLATVLAGTALAHMLGIV
jgi:hypothetical protein